MANEWRVHPLLRGRFASDYPDDLQVIAHDGGPVLTPHVPEIVWVTVTSMDGDLFRGRVQSRPHNLRSVGQGDEIRFVMPEGTAPRELLEQAAGYMRLPVASLTGWLAPVMVTDKYLRERGAWVIHPCERCGLSELFDAPSDLMRALFPHAPPEAGRSGFAAPCPQCGGEQRLESRSSPPAADDVGRKYLQALRSQVEAMGAIAALLGSITDDAAAVAVLPELKKVTARYEELRKEIESHKLSEGDHLKLAREHYQAYLAAHSDVTVNTVAAQSNAALARTRAPGKVAEIGEVEKRLGLA
jgi:hypothetical protein